MNIMMRACVWRIEFTARSEDIDFVDKTPPILSEPGAFVAFSLADSCLLSICSSFWLVVESWSNPDHKNDD